MERAVARVMGVAALFLAAACVLCLTWMYPEVDDGETT